MKALSHNMGISIFQPAKIMNIWPAVKLDCKIWWIMISDIVAVPVCLRQCFEAILHFMRLLMDNVIGCLSDCYLLVASCPILVSTFRFSWLYWICLSDPLDLSKLNFFSRIIKRMSLVISWSVRLTRGLCPHDTVPRLDFSQCWVDMTNS